MSSEASTATERRCAYHATRPAIAICSGCGEDICARCHRAALNGYALCATCEGRLEKAMRTRWETASGFFSHVHAFLWTTVAVLSSTRAFFGSMTSRGPWLKPALFGVIAYTIGRSAAVGWQLAFVDSFVSDFATQAGIPGDVALFLMIAALPLAGPLFLALHVGLLHVALRMFGAPSDWKLVTRIVSYASAAFLFQIVPPVAEFPIGYMLAIVWLVNVELVAVRHYFDLGMWKSMGVVFIPFMLLTLFGL